MGKSRGKEYRCAPTLRKPSESKLAAAAECGAGARQASSDRSGAVAWNRRSGTWTDEDGKEVDQTFLSFGEGATRRQIKDPLRSLFVRPSQFLTTSCWLFQRGRPAGIAPDPNVTGTWPHRQ